MVQQSIILKQSIINRWRIF